MNWTDVQRKMFAALLSLSVAAGTTVTAQAVELASGNVDVQVVNNTNGVAKIEAPSEFVSGWNEFDVISNIPCAVFVEHLDGTSEKLGCALVDASSGRYRFKVDAREGDIIGIALRGDINGDGRVMSSDLTYLSRFLSGEYDNGIFGKYAADVNNDDRVMSSDLTYLSRFLSGSYALSWNVTWELPDDPNVNASASLSANGVNEIHVGDTVLFTLDTDVVGDYSVEYKLMRGNAVVNNISLTGLGDTGGEVVFNTTEGDYTLYATVITESLTEIEAKPVSISVTNAAPVLTEDVGVHIDYANTTVGYDDAVHVWVEPDSSGGAVDPDGDDVRLQFETDDGRPFTGSYYPAGTHSVRVYAIDQWGKRSDVRTLTFTVDAVDTVPPLSSETTTVHIGDYFDIDIAEVVEDKFTKIEVRNEAGELVECDLSRVDKTGGQLAITGEIGHLTVHAMGYDYHGKEVDFGFINVEVTNAAPEMPVLKHVVNPTDFQQEYVTGEAKIGVDFINQAVDPDGDDVSLWLVSADGADDVILSKDGVLSMQYYSQGHHSITVYAQDEWGAKSEPVVYEFDINNTLPTGRLVADIDYEDLRYEGDKPSSDTLMAHVTINIETEDADGNNTKVEFADEHGELIPDADALKTGYYKGTHTVYYYVVDQWGDRSELIAESFTVDLAPKAPTVDVNGNGYMTVHVGDEFEINVDTKHFGTTTVRYELVEKGTQTDYSDKLVGVGGELTYTGGVARILREGNYDLIVTIVPSVGEEYHVGTIDMTVTNAAPSVPDVQAIVSATNVTVDSDNDVLSYVDISVTSTDADPNDEFVYEFVSGEDLVSGYYKNGVYTIKVRAVDEWGKASEYATCTFTVDNTDARPRFITPSVVEHIGTDFEIEMHEGSLSLDAVNPITYTLVDSEGRETIVSSLTLSGGTMNVDTAVGHYTLKAVAHVDNNGDGVSDVDYYVGSIAIEITNIAPTLVVNDITVPSIRTDDETNVDIGTVNVSVTTGDADDDSYELYYQLDNEGDFIKANRTDGFVFEVPVGAHVLTMYTVDEWGLKSDVVVEEVMVGSLFSDNKWLPVLEHDETGRFENSHKPNAEQYVDFTVTWLKDGQPGTIPVDEEVTFVYEVDGDFVSDLNTHYSLGHHVVKVYAVDDYGIHSEVATYEFDLTTITPKVTLEYWWNEVADKVELKSKVAYSSNQTNPGDAVARYAELISRVYVTDLTAGTAEQLVETYNGLNNGVHLPDHVLVNYDFKPGSRYTVRLESVNVWGKSSEQSQTFLVPVNAPSYTIERHVLGTYSPETGLTQVSFEFSSFMMGDEYTFEYTIDGEPAETLNTSYGVGVHTVTVQAIHNTNPSLNSVLDSYTFEITNLAPLSPEVVVHIDRDDVDVTGRVKASFTAQATDPDGDIVMYNIYSGVDGELLHSKVSDLSVMTDYYSRTGGNLFAVEAVDMHDNVSGRVYVQLGFKNSKPVIKSITATPDYGSAVNEDGAVKIPVNFDCVYTDADGDVCEVTYDVFGDAVESGDLFEAGSYVLVATVTDKFGGRTTMSQSFDVEVQAPETASFTYAFSDASVVENFVCPYTGDAALKTVFSVENPLPGYTYEWVINGETYTGVTVEGYVKYTQDFVSLVAIDENGQRSPAEKRLVGYSAGSKPVLSVQSHVDKNRFTGEYTPDAAVYVTFTPSVTGSSLNKVYYRNLGDEDSEFTTVVPDGYYGAAQHRFEAYAVDVWGRQSAAQFVSVDLTNKAPSLTKFDFNYVLSSAGVVNAYTEDAEVRVSIESAVTDAEDDDFKVYAIVGRDGSPVDISQVRKTFPANQSFEIGLYVVDKWGNTTETMWKTLNIVAQKPVIGFINFDEFDVSDIVNPYTAGAYADVPISVSCASEVKYHVTYGGDVVYEGYKPVGAAHDNPISVRVTFDNPTLEAYVVDFLGQKSDVRHIQVENSLFGSEPVVNSFTLESTAEYRDAYTTSARRKVTYTASFSVNDFRAVLYDGDREVVSSDTSSVFDEYLALGSYNRKVVVYDVWGRKAEKSLNFSLTNNAPRLDEIESTINWGNIENKYTGNARVEVQSNVVAYDLDAKSTVKVLYSIDGSKYAEDPDFRVRKFSKGSHTIKAKAVDEWGHESPEYTYTLDVSTGISVDLMGSINTSGVGSGLQANTMLPSSLENNARFYKLEYSNNNGPRELIAQDVTNNYQSIPKTNYSDMSDGTYTLRVYATSVIGEEVTDYITYTIDRY